MIEKKRRIIGKACLGCRAIVNVDYPYGSIYDNGQKCTANYGYVSVNKAKLRAFVVGINEPISELEGVVIAVIYHNDSKENRLVVAKEGDYLDGASIASAIQFEQRKHPYKMDCLYEKSCGAVLYTVKDDQIKYLILQDNNGYCSLAKGHAEIGESEKETAMREIWEETSVRPTIKDGFRQEVRFKMRNGVTKTVVYFLGEFAHQVAQKNEGFENYTHLLVSYEKALELLTFENTRNLVRQAHAFILEQKLV